MKKVQPIANISAAELEAMNTAALITLAKTGAEIDTSQKEYTEAQKESQKPRGKIVRALKVSYVQLQTAGIVPEVVKFREWYEQNVGVKLGTHEETLAKAFDVFVRPGWLQEIQYDQIKARCLEKAANIATEVKSDLTHPALKSAVEILQSPAGDKDKFEALKALYETLKPAKALDYEKALEMCQKLVASDYETTMLSETRESVVRDAQTSRFAENGHRKAKAIFQQIVRLMFTFNGVGSADSILPAEMLNAWTDEVESDLLKAQTAAAATHAPAAPITIITPETVTCETPAELAAA